MLSVDSNADSIAVSVFVDWLGLSNTESEANPNNNLMMRQAGLYNIVIHWAFMPLYSDCLLRRKW